MSKPLLSILLLSVLSACVSTSKYTVNVDSVSDAEATMNKTTFIITSGMKDVTDTDLRFKEYSKMTSNSLIKRGYKPCRDKTNCDMLILLSYGIGDAKTKTSERTVPVYGGNSGTTTQVYNNYGQNLGSFSTQPSNPYAPTGYRSVTDTYEQYLRTIVLTAFDFKSATQTGNSPQMVWETKITSEGSSGDLRKVFPVMLLGSYRYFGDNTGSKQEVNLNLGENDPQVGEILGFQASPSSLPRKPSNVKKQK